MPGHSGIQGNEVADKLARIGSSTPFTGPEPAIGISSNLIRNTVFDIFRKKQYLNWLSSKGQRQAKELNQGCPSASHDDEEMAVHILCECEAYSTYRFEHLCRHLLEPWKLHDIPVRCLLNFASATGLF